MVFLYKIFIVFSFLTTSLTAFDVRVLLEKFTFSNNKNVECKISSQHGMAISGIDDIIHGPVTIVVTPEKFLIDGKEFLDDMIEVNPALPSHYDKKITLFVDNWEKKSHEWCYENFKKLDTFFEKFVNDRNFRDYDILYNVMQSCIDDSIATFIQGIEHPVISYESLICLAKGQLHNQLKVLFVQAVHEKKSSKSFLQQLQKSEKIRMDFFSKILEKILIDFLYEYYLGLPHKIIEQVMKDETGCLLFDKNKYLGTFYLIRQKDFALLINSLDIDDYLFSVLYSEGWPGWPMEVYKALAVATRTYLVEKILKANKSKRLYHIENSIKHQTYKGHHKYQQLKEAVDATRNVFIAYKGEPIVAMFDACCGGVIPAKIDGYDFVHHPYLARTKACHYCKRFWIYDWKKELSKLEIAEILAQDYPGISDITDIKITKRDAAGLVKEVVIITKKQTFKVPGKKIYSLFPAVKSFSYSIKKRGKMYLFQGRGYGHHMGLCQWGSLGMVKDNWNYQKILEFYYPGIEFAKLALSR